MKKKTIKKLVLAKETLLELNPTDLKEAAGQVTGLYCTIDTTCCTENSKHSCRC